MRRLRPSNFVSIVALIAVAFARGHAQAAPIVLRTSTLLDGRGGTRTNVDLLIENGKISRIAGRGAVPAGAQLIDLSGKTVLPGLIDAHDHLMWYFNKAVRYHSGNDGDNPDDTHRAVALNAYGSKLGVAMPVFMQNLFGEQAVFLLSR